MKETVSQAETRTKELEGQVENLQKVRECLDEIQMGGALVRVSRKTLDIFYHGYFSL